MANASERVLVCAPFGRDAELITRELQAAGIGADVCASPAEVREGMAQGAAAALIADEALSSRAVRELAEQVAGQPPWSDFPFVVMTSGGDNTEASRQRVRLLEPLGNVTLVERPVRIATLVSSVRAALRARRHQYQLAQYLQQKAETEQEMERRNHELTVANRQLEEFAYVSSHDLQEPLRVVNTFSELLLRRCAKDDVESQRFALFIHDGVQRMENLLRDLLSFSRVISDEDSAKGSADLMKCVATAAATLNGRIEEAEAEIVWAELPVVRGDESQLTQVFQNLLSNALKYRKPGLPARVEISAHRERDEWEIEVRDNGIGFEPQYAERIFGLFKRLHKEEYPGTGLGLAICQRIVERSGGHIRAEGKPGEGSVFRVRLPAVEGSSAASGAAVREQAATDSAYES